MFNPVWQIKANRAKAFGLVRNSERPLDAKQEAKEVPADKKAEKQPEPEENEEGLISDAEAY